MEIERKFLVRQMPDLAQFSHRTIEQGYLCTAPVVRVRRDGDDYYLTYKGGGMMAREEYNLPLDQPSYAHLREKCDGRIIEKERYLIPLDDAAEAFAREDEAENRIAQGLNVELDIFAGDLAGMVLAEVEFASVEEAERFTPPAWLGEDVTYDPRYHNSYMSRQPKTEGQ